LAFFIAWEIRGAQHKGWKQVMACRSARQCKGDAGISRAQRNPLAKEMSAADQDCGERAKTGAVGSFITGYRRQLAAECGQAECGNAAPIGDAPRL
jgi:hypothetical protein